MLTAQGLKDAAIEKAGLRDFGETFSGEALEAWVEDLNHPRLNDFGQSALASLMVGDLARRLQVTRCLEQNPQIEEVELPTLLYISGLERTGTTFLHNLLSLHPKSRPLLRWELMRPVPPPEAGTYRDDPRIARTQASIDKQRGTLLEQMHWVDADDPEECQWGMLDGSSPLGGSAFSIMPTWGKWMEQRNPVAGFREYRRLMKLLLWKNPVPAGGHLVLKCPQFAGMLSPFAKVFPEARFILTHRDPYRTIVSVCTLISGILTPFMSDPSTLQRSPYLPDCSIDRAEAHMAAMATFCEGDHAISNVAYPNLVRDPIATVQTIYESLGVDAPSDLTNKINAFETAQRAGKRAKPPQVLPDFGLEHDAFLARSRIADYCHQFRIVPERKRQTGA
ncbi:MAG: sulfotransferase [Myxococcota bacterium]